MERGTFGRICCPLKSISIAGCGPVLLSGIRDGKIDNAAAADSLARHAGHVGAGCVAECELEAAISIVGACCSHRNNCRTCSILTIQ